MSALSLLELEGVSACCDDEKWELLPGWPHEASTCGQVRALDRIDAEGRLHLGGMLPPQPDKRPGKGYLYYDLRDGRRRRRIPAAVAVLEAHCGQRPGPGYEACHNDGVRTDNHLARIRWDTKAANRADREKHRLVTEAVTDGPENSRNCHRPQVRGGAVPRTHLSRPLCHSDRPHGTGRLPFPFNFPSVFPSLNPSSILRSLRSRRIPR